MALLNRIDKILFNSKWSQKILLILKMKTLKVKTSVCYQSNSVQIDYKKKLISFVEN